MPELPQPDLLDRSGRMRRIIIALLVAAPVGALAYYLAYSLSRPDTLPSQTDLELGGSAGRALKFVWTTAGLVFFAVFTIALAIQNKLAKRASEAERLPKAQLE